jgi:hypothetical protein
VLRQAPDRVPGRSVIAIDQFEETFTLCRDESERVAFLDAIAHAGRDSDVSVVLTIR